VRGLTRDAEVSGRLGFAGVSGFLFFGSHNTVFIRFSLLDASTDLLPV
jgi:hypothetical protein